MKKTVLITGGAKGIGEAIARIFHKNGYNTVITYNKSEKKALKLQEELGIYVTRCDVSDEESVKKAVEFASKITGKIDVLVNNAAQSLAQKLITETTSYEWTNIFDVNVRGSFYCCKEVLPFMINEKCGSIINISSIWGITGGSCEVAYSASKSAIIGLTKALAKEVGPSNITVNCIAPGVIDTDMNSHLSKYEIEALKEETPLGVIGEPCDVAETAFYLAQSRFITGQVISPNGGMVI